MYLFTKLCHFISRIGVRYLNSPPHRTPLPSLSCLSWLSERKPATIRIISIYFDILFCQKYVFVIHCHLLGLVVRYWFGELKGGWLELKLGRFGWWWKERCHLNSTSSRLLLRLITDTERFLRETLHYHPKCCWDLALASNKIMEGPR